MLHLERHGTGRLLVCLHGWGMNSELEKADFEPVFERRMGWERLYLDLPGMGRSPAHPQVKNLDDMLSVLLSAVHDFTQGASVCAVGHVSGRLSGAWHCGRLS